jgi:hypothetical protein
LNQLLASFNKQSLFDEPKFDTTKDRAGVSQIEIEPGSKIPFRSPYRISPKEEEELQRQLTAVIKHG